MKPVLAPMVRAGFIGMQRLSAKYGADTLYTDAIFPQNIISSNIFESQDMLLFIRKDIRVLYLDKSLLPKTCVQLVGNDPEILSTCINILSPYVKRIDLNCGCTRNFTHQGGYGADMLNKPESLLSLLKTLVHKHPDIKFSVKIRLLQTEINTTQFIRDLLQTGVGEINVHMRGIQQERDKDEADFKQFARIYKQIDKTEQVKITANGGIISIKDYLEFKSLFDENNVPRVMLASGAVRNASFFRVICTNIEGKEIKEYPLKQVISQNDRNTKPIKVNIHKSQRDS
ncbi:tRNA-dihydrouridine_synthase [Hexamita inflata]|uniref:tRNA-dihydrouridine synthase n=1 Tax=Hexamita inflata TaxID=28002 RepID=A0ABP1GGV0_9EUKA